MTTNTTTLVKQLRNALIDARDDVQAELQRCTELAGRPATDRRLAAQVALALDVDIAITDADKWLAEPPTQEQQMITAERLAEIDLVTERPRRWYMCADGVRRWVSNDQPCDKSDESDLWRCTVCGRTGTVGRCCGEETRERCAKAAEAEDVAPTDDPIGVQECIAAAIRRA